MTSAPHEEPRALVVDATCLSHFARADRLDVLRGLLSADECWTTKVVLQELSKAHAAYPTLELVTEGNRLSIAEFDTAAGHRAARASVPGRKTLGVRCGQLDRRAPCDRRYGLL
jgi:hypothetical protein